MAIDFTALPENGNSFQNEGLNKAKIIKAEMGISQASQRPQLTVTFETDKGDRVMEFYQDSDKSFMMFKLRCLLEAFEIPLQGAMELHDIAKILPRNKQIAIYLATNERGYATIDYSDKTGDGVGIDTIANAFGGPVMLQGPADGQLGSEPDLAVVPGDDLPFPTPSEVAEELNKTADQSQPVVSFETEDF